MSGKQELLKSLKATLKSGDRDLEDLRIDLLFRFSDSLEELVCLIEMGEYSYRTRLCLAIKAILCMTSGCPENLLHLYMSHINRPDRFRFLTRLTKKFPKNNLWYFKKRAKEVLDGYEYREYIKGLL